MTLRDRMLITLNFLQVIFYFVKMLIKREDHLIFSREGVARRERKESIQENDLFMKLLNLYYHAMDHDCLFACLKELAKQTTDGTLRTTSQVLKHTLKTMSCQPRSLKSLCRNTMYKSLDMKLVPGVNRLQLPAPLKEYILEFKH